MYTQLHKIYTSLNVLPTDLRIYPSPKGIIAGNLKIILENDGIIQCHMTEATTLPSQLEKVRVETDAKFVLLVEKETVFKKLIEQMCFKKLENMILLTGKGYPDVNIRLFLKKIMEHKQLKIYCLVDGDPYGIHIMIVYRYGSKAFDYVKEKVSCPEVRWIGITPSEIKKLNLPRSPMTSFDRKTLDKLLEKNNISKEIKDELSILKSLDAKTEIEYLSLPPFNYNLVDYISEKIKHDLCI